MGKTSFTLSLAKNIAVDAQVPIGFFSLEMNNVQLVNHLISNVCEIVGSKILNGQLTPDEWDRLDKRLRNLQGAQVYVDDTPGLSVFELRTKARRLVREKGVGVIMIDYLQLMNANGMKFGSRPTAGGWQKYFFIVLAAIVYLWLVNAVRKNEFGPWGSWGAVMVIGGAVGNVIDRFIHGKVVDFLLFYGESWAYPAFKIGRAHV